MIHSRLINYRFHRGDIVDKYEYKVREEEIHALIREREYAQAVDIADTIDWRRVKSIKMLCTISDLYKINRRYQESKEILLMAYERYPGGRLIVYSLCELSIKLEEYVQAIEYYKEYVTLAPKDSGRYILQYRLYEAQDVPLEERIEVLEEFKRKDYREKWGYELAYLYHRLGLASKCVDECDELIVTFGEGKYVIKAMELKKLHTPLTAGQQAKYDDYFKESDEEITSEAGISDSVSDQPSSTDYADLQAAPTTDMSEEDEIQVKTVDVGQYNTMNLQEALAESMKDLWGNEDMESQPPSSPEEDIEDNTIFGTSPMAGPRYAQDPDAFSADNWEDTGEVTISDLEQSPETRDEIDVVEQAEEQEEVQEDVPAHVVVPVAGGVREIYADSSDEDLLNEETKRIPTESVVVYLEAERLKEQMQNSSASLQASVTQTEAIPGAVTGQLESVGSISSEYDQMLAQEYDGQIRLAISEGEKIEKQITGQLSIDDILAGWEEAKKENERKREEEVKRRILQHTGSLFDEFDEDTRATLLAQLEKAFMDAIVKESNGAIESDALGKKIRKEALRAVEYLSKESLPVEDNAQKEEEIIDSEPVEEVSGEVEVTPELTSPQEETKPEDIEDTAEEKEQEELETEISSEETEEVDEPEVKSAEELQEESGEEVQEETEDSEEVKAVIKALEEDESEDNSVSQPVSDNDDESETPTDNEGNRVLSEEEEELFSSYLTRKSTRKQIIAAMENMSMAAYSGNVIVTGEEGVGTVDLAKKLAVQMKSMDANFVGQSAAKISGKGLNGKDIAAIFEKINGGAMIIEAARGMKKSTVEALIKALENENLGVLVILEDTSEAIDRMLTALPKLRDLFNVRIDLKALDDKALVNYACEYALSQEYAIDEYAILALHTRIAEMQTQDHQVTVAEVRDLVDDAIYYADKKTPGHFFDIILHKRYDKEDMIILREKDFMHY